MPWLGWLDRRPIVSMRLNDVELTRRGQAWQIDYIVPQLTLHSISRSTHQQDHSQPYLGTQVFSYKHLHLLHQHQPRHLSSTPIHMPLIASAIGFASRKVSESVNNHHNNGNESVQPQNPDNCNYEDNLDRQNQGSLGLGPYSGSTDHVRQEELCDPRQQRDQKQTSYPANESDDGWMAPPPSYPHNQDQRQSMDNSFARPGPARDSRSPAPPQTMGYPHPGQQYPSTEQAYASEDRSRADYYEAKYYQAQQFQAQSAQFGGGDYMGYDQQSSRRRGRRGGRRRGGMGRAGLIGMLRNH